MTHHASRRGEWVVGALVLGIVALLFAPLPPPAIDVLLSANLAFALGLLLVAAFSGTPLRLASLPTLLLLSTLFRLALNVSTTRLILSRADAGRLVAGIGETVVHGSLIVGGVVFAIVSAVHFIVIARGTERIAEVAARFALDALPGRQAALDAERRAGSAEATQAARRSRELMRESQLYGALDGATRFVKGDAIAALLITGINMIAGLAVGVGRDGLPLAEAAHLYTVLTIGDGLCALIPSLLIATATGLVITRVAGSRDADDVAGELAAELRRNPRTLALVAGFLAVLALLPGMPWAVLGTGAVALTAGFWRLDSRRRTRSREDERALVSFELSAAGSEALAPALARGELAAALDRWRAELEARLGARLGSVSLRAGTELPSGVVWRALLEGEAVRARRDLGDADPVAALVADADAVLTAHPEAVLTIQRVHERLDALAHDQPALVNAVLPSRLDHAGLTELLRQLVRERVPIEPLGRVLEAVASAPVEKTPQAPEALAERVRVALGNRVARAHLIVDDADPRLPALLLAGDFEDLLANLRSDGTAPRDAGRVGDLGEALRRAVESSRCRVVVVAQRLRPTLRDIARGAGIDVAVLGLDELGSTTLVEPRGVVRLG